MKEILSKISDNWQDYRNHCLRKTKGGYMSRPIRQNHKVYGLIKKDWKNVVEGLVDSNRYFIKSSLGDGVVVPTPWLAIMDKSITEKASEGFYIVYLFSRSAKQLYLSMTIASLQFERIYKNKTRCLEKIDESRLHFRKIFNHHKPQNSENIAIDLVEDDYNLESPIVGTSRFLINSFEKGTCFAKQYNLDNLDNNSLNSDLNEFLNSYNKIAEDPQAESLNIIAESFVKDIKPANLNYKIPDFKIRKHKKVKRKISIVVSAKRKRRTQESKKIGKAGEEHVYLYEYNKLKKLGKEDLSKKIKKHFAKFEYPGWDITSFNEKGEKIYIEVKSTTAKAINSFEITDNEWMGAKTEKAKYFVYLVVNALNEKIKISEKICNPAELVKKKRIQISTSLYEIKL